MLLIEEGPNVRIAASVTGPSKDPVATRLAAARAAAGSPRYPLRTSARSAARQRPICSVTEKAVRTWGRRAAEGRMEGEESSGPMGFGAGGRFAGEPGGAAERRGKGRGSGEVCIGAGAGARAM